MDYHKRISQEVYKEHKIQVVDYSGLKDDEPGVLLQLSQKTIIESSHHPVLLLEIVNNVRINDDVMVILTNYVKNIEDYVSKYACIGALPRVLSQQLSTAKLTLEVFESKEEALEYLVS